MDDAVIKADTFAIVSPTDETTPRLHPVITIDEHGTVTGLLFDAQSASMTATVIADKLTVDGVEVTPEEFRALVETKRAVSEIASSIARVTGRIESADGARYIDFDTMACDPETYEGMAAQCGDLGSDLGGVSFAARLEREIESVRAMLLAKNRAYGNSALDPVRVFSSASPVEQLKVRLDDKISRLVRGEAAGEDVEADLLGYLFLLRVARQIEAERGGDGQ